MFLTYIFVFSDNTLLKILRYDNKSTSIADVVDQKLSSIATRQGLSKRETEVFFLLAKGRDSPYIQKSLSISQGTVSTYKQRIYSKFGVHKNQELIDAVYNIDENTQKS
jgi:DNA-binding NarL/FixJ family response regulator